MQKKQQTPENKYARLKQFRNVNYMRPKKDSFLKSLEKDFTQATPFTIGLDKIIQSRATELSHFLGIIKNKPNTRLAFQKLRKYERRRAMSHNYYRIPLKVRYSSLKDRLASGGETKQRSRCRKHRRKTKFMLQVYTKRKQNGKWLQTHVWHAKRFHMEALYGFKIPMRCNEKFNRAAFRYASHSSCVIDRSYLQVLEVEGKKEDLLQFFFEHGWDQGKFLNSLNKLENSKYMQGRKMQTILLKNDQSEILGPVDLIWLANQDSVWMIFMPSIQIEEITAILEDFQVKNISSHFCQFQLIGPQSLQMLRKVLIPLVQKCPSDLSQPNDFACWQSGRILGINEIQAISTNFRFNERIFKQQHLQSLFGSQVDSNVQEIVRQKFPQIPAILQEESLLFKEEIRLAMKREPPFKYEACSRTSYTHRKNKKSVKQLISTLQKDYNNKKSKSSKMAPIEQEKQETKTPLEESHPPSHIQPSIEKHFKTEVDTSSKSADKISGIVIKTPFHSRDHFAHKLRLMFPAGYALDILRRLVYVGAKAIGMKQYKAIHTESKEFNFPQDYPLTKAGLQHSYKHAQQSLLKYCKLPPRKRYDYFNVGFAMPFRSEWRSLKSKAMQAASGLHLLPCVIYCKGRGVISELAYIYPKKQDASILGTNLASKELMKALVIQFIRNRLQTATTEEDATSQVIKAQLKKIPLSKQERANLQKEPNESNIALNSDLTLNIEGAGEIDENIIGFVTSGGYSLKEGQSIAKGWILTDSKGIGGKEVFLRNPRARRIVEGRVEILKSIKGTRLY